MTYEQWEQTVPEVVKQDLTWRVQAFRLALFLSACANVDATAMEHEPRLVHISAQLCRAAGSVAANIAEGYRRKSPKDRVRYYEYALGSAEEAKTWFLSGRAAIANDALEARMALVRSITRLLLTMIRSARPSEPFTPTPTAV